MSSAAAEPAPAAGPADRPRLRSSLVLRKSADGFIAKDPTARTYVRIGEREHFLLTRLEEPRDGLRREFEKQFSEPISEEDFADFLKLCARRGLLEGSEPAAPIDDDLGDFGDEPEPAPGAGEGQTGKRKSFADLLYFRKSLCDPDRFLTRLEPSVRFLFAPAFLTAAGSVFAIALLIFASDPAAPLRDVNAARSWEAAVLTVALLLGVTVCHEIGHGLTCKHFGGEVREMGVLMLLCMPCLFCNVSDAWLFEKRWQRVAVTMAGTCVDAVFWAIAVILWRLTVGGSWPNTFACMLMSVTGVRALMNLNPLTRLDGYYALTDLLAVPNLRQVAREQWMRAVRRVLWGEKPSSGAAVNRAAFVYGALCWWFYVVALLGSFTGVVRVVQGRAGPFEMFVTAVLILFLPKRVFKGLSKGEIVRMLRKRPSRAMMWGGALSAAAFAAFVIPAPSTAGGEFTIRPTRRVEVHAEVAAFVKAIHVREGERVEPGRLLAELEIPDLTSRISQKKSELAETAALLRRFEAGPRPEEVREAQLRVARAEAWRDLGRQDLDRAKIVFEQEMLRAGEEVSQYRAELDLGISSLERSKRLFDRQALPGEQYRAEIKKVEMLRSKLQQAEALKRQKEIGGTRAAEAELARRDQELAEARGALGLLQAGTRPEDVEAERAKFARVTEELRLLESQTEKLRVVSPAGGIVVTPRVHERVGAYMIQGAVLVELEDVGTGVVEIAVPEDDVAGVAPGQPVELKVRALPYAKFSSQVGRVAPIAAKAAPNVPGTVAVYCDVENPEAVLRSGMTGYARIRRGDRSLAVAAVTQVVKYLRTEFWW